MKSGSCISLAASCAMGGKKQEPTPGAVHAALQNVEGGADDRKRAIRQLESWSPKIEVNEDTIKLYLALNSLCTTVIGSRTSH